MTETQQRVLDDYIATLAPAKLATLLERHAAASLPRVRAWQEKYAGTELEGHFTTLAIAMESL